MTYYEFNLKKQLMWFTSEYVRCIKVPAPPNHALMQGKGNTFYVLFTSSYIVIDKTNRGKDIEWGQAPTNCPILCNSYGIS